MNDTGTNTADITNVIEMMALEISFIASIAAVRVLDAQVELGVNRLDHHNGIIDHNRNSQQQG